MSWRAGSGCSSLARPGCGVRTRHGRCGRLLRACSNTWGPVWAAAHCGGRQPDHRPDRRAPGHGASGPGRRSSSHSILQWPLKPFKLTPAISRTPSIYSGSRSDKPRIPSRVFFIARWTPQPSTCSFLLFCRLSEACARTNRSESRASPFGCKRSFEAHRWRERTLQGEIGKKAAMFGDLTFWLFVAPGLLLGLYAQARIQANYARYSRVGTSAALRERRWREHCWMRSGLQSVRIELTPGMLSDHYDPHSRRYALVQRSTTRQALRPRASLHMKLAMHCKMPPGICLSRRDR